MPDLERYFVYVVRTEKNTLYVGQTNNLERRMKEHKGRSKGARYLRMFESFELVYSEQYGSRKEAMVREAELKRWGKARKEQLVRK